MRRATIRKVVLTALAAISFPAATAVQAQDWLSLPSLTRPAEAEKLTARPIVSTRVVKPGDALTVAMEMTVAEKFWVYGPVPGGQIVQARPLVVRAGKSPLEVGEPLFPATRSHVDDAGQGRTDTYNTYEGTFVVYLPVKVPQATPAGTYSLPITVEAQLCDPNTCLLPTLNVSADVEVGPETAASPEWTESLQRGLSRAAPAWHWQGRGETQPAAPAVPAPGLDLSTGAALLLALLAGLVLNIMPCVLPVIPLKVLSIIQQARESRRRFFVLGVSFVGGILLFFVALAALNAVLRAGFQYTFQWGDHFRQPAFVYGMALLLVGVAMNLFGVLTVTVPGRLAGAEPGEGARGAVGMGLLTGVLSTPCSFGILTAAVGWAQSKPLWLGTVAILLIGAGMALPYAVLTACPKLLSRVPRAGRWSERFKQAMGFLLLLVAVWLIGTQVAEARPIWALGYAVVLAACLWTWGAWVTFQTPPARRWAIRAAAAALAVAAGWWMLGSHESQGVRFEQFDQARIDQARAQGQIVLIDFTADWCWTCKTVEWRVYDDAAVAEVLRKRNVLVIKGDTTTADLPANKLLKDLGEPGVPVTVIFPPGSAPPLRLHGVFSPDDLLKALAAFSR